MSGFHFVEGETPLKPKKKARPFLKWAGGKTQLIEEISVKFPFKSSEKFSYYEPFVGGGAVLFWVLQNFPQVTSAHINDINTDLTNCYTQIRDSIDPLINILKKLEVQFLKKDDEGRSRFFYEKRDEFNRKRVAKVKRAALLIFLNKTCFNGLYRVNRKNEFNVPVGRYKNPTICDSDNLVKISQLLDKVEIYNSDFYKLLPNNHERNLVYLDPPYKPINKTSNFNNYAQGGFDDSEQVRLKEYCDKLTEEKCYWILSNSDVKTQDNPDLFFDELYADYKINRVLANRRINTDAKKRGSLNELLITNY